MNEVDPSLRAALAKLPDLNTLNATSLSAFRESMAAEPLQDGVDQGVQYNWITIPRQGDQDVRALLYRPQSFRDRIPAILNIHGGGYVLGNPVREHASAIALVCRLGCAVLSVQYRLAPESPYPDALDDCIAAFEWLHAEPAEPFVDLSRIAVRGVSAGGGLAIGMTLRLRDAGQVLPRHLHLICPMLDNEAKPPARSGHYVWTRSANEFGWRSYLGGLVDNPPSYAVPARAGDLSGMPPTFVAIGDLDLFISENLSFASKLVDVEVPLEMHIYPGAYHGFNVVQDSAFAISLKTQSEAALARAFSMH